MRSTTKHKASKKGYKHKNDSIIVLTTGLGMTNHMRCIYFRAKRMNISVAEYMSRFPKV